MKKERFIWIGIVLLLIGGLLYIDYTRRNNYVETSQLDSLKQELIVVENKLGQQVARQNVVFADSQKELKDKTKEIFQLKDKDQKNIKRINALIQARTTVVIEKPVLAKYLDTVGMRRFSDSVEAVCADVIRFYRDSARIIGASFEINKEQDPYLQLEGKIQKEGIEIASVNLPDTMSISLEEMKSGLFRRGIDGKIRFWTPKKMTVSVLHSNPYLITNSMTSIVNNPKVKGRWLERLLLVGTGIFLGSQLIK